MTSIAMVGDSHSVTHFKYLQPFLESKGYQVGYYKPKVGWSARAFIERSDVNIHDMPKDIDTAVIALGGNNAELNDEKYFARLDTFIDRLKESGIKKIVWLGPMYTDPNIAPDTAIRHDYTREAQKRYFDKTKYTWIDMYPYSQKGHYQDGIHFVPSQYEYMIEQTKNAIHTGLSRPYWLAKPRYYWIPTLAVAMLALGGYYVYTYVTEEETWDTPRIS